MVYSIIRSLIFKGSFILVILVRDCVVRNDIQVILFLLAILMILLVLVNNE
jgi:hypothetical protein